MGHRAHVPMVWCQQPESLECLHSAWVRIKPDRTVRRMKTLGAMCCGHKSGLDTRSVNWPLVWGPATDVKSCRSGPASEEPCCMCLSEFKSAGQGPSPGKDPQSVPVGRSTSNCSVAPGLRGSYIQISATGETGHPRDSCWIELGV